MESEVKYANNVRSVHLPDDKHLALKNLTEIFDSGITTTADNKSASQFSIAVSKNNNNNNDDDVVSSTDQLIFQVAASVVEKLKEKLEEPKIKLIMAELQVGGSELVELAGLNDQEAATHQFCGLEEQEKIIEATSQLSAIEISRVCNTLYICVAFSFSSNVFKSKVAKFK